MVAALRAEDYSIVQWGDHSMPANATMLALVAATVALFTMGATISADAEQIDPRCLKLKTKDPVMRIKCTCFLRNNGQIRYSGGTRKLVIWSLAEYDGYLACVKRNGVVLQ